MTRIKKTALHYCEVLNKIYWKIPKTDPEMIAAEATERLRFHRYVGTISIVWDMQLDTFLVKHQPGKQQ